MPKALSGQSMLQPTDNPVIAGVISIAISAILTILVREFARRYGHVAKPKSDRWHKKPTAMLGGVAIAAATLIGYLVFVPKNTQSLVVVGASAWLFVVGLIDDVFNIKPYQKLFGQLIGATVVVG